MKPEQVEESRRFPLDLGNVAAGALLGALVGAVASVVGVAMRPYTTVVMAAAVAGFLGVVASVVPHRSDQRSRGRHRAVTRPLARWARADGVRHLSRPGR